MASMWRRLFGRSERDALAPLYHAVVAEARRPGWYVDGAVPDTLEGRFGMVAAVLSLVLLRLEREGASTRAPSALLAELFVADMDGQLRERGIGDIVVGKHIGRLMGALGGRLGALREALAGGDLPDVIARNIHGGIAAPDVAARYVQNEVERLRDALAAMPADALIRGEWPR